MTNQELRRMHREATRELNDRLCRGIRKLSYRQLRKIYKHYLANCDTRRMVHNEALRRGYKLSAFGG